MIIMPLITVFTPTYNRAGKLHRVFNSLLGQTFKDFEWLIIDDGSTDDTKTIVEQFKQQRPQFPIHYHFQQNAGKHIAHNKALQLAKGEWFHIADSDDELEPQTLEVFMRTWEEIPAEQKHLFSGIAACCKDQYGRRISDPVPGGVFDGSFRELFYKYKFRKEVFMINKTGIMRQYLFPDHIRNYLFPEGIVWRRMTGKYKLRVINDEMRIYYINEAHSLMTAAKSPRAKALSNCLESSSVLNDDMGYFKYDPVYFFKMAMVYHSFWPFLNKQQRKWVSLRPGAKIFAGSLFFAGRMYNKVLLFLYKKNSN